MQCPCVQSPAAGGGFVVPGCLWLLGGAFVGPFLCKVCVFALCFVGWHTQLYQLAAAVELSSTATVMPGPLGDACEAGGQWAPVAPAGLPLLLSWQGASCAALCGCFAAGGEGGWIYVWTWPSLHVQGPSGCWGACM